MSDLPEKRAVVLHVNGHPMPTNLGPVLRERGYTDIVVYRINNGVDFTKSAHVEAERLVESLAKQKAFRQPADYFLMPGGVVDIQLMMYIAIWALVGTPPNIIILRQQTSEDSLRSTNVYTVSEIVPAVGWRQYWRNEGRTKWVLPENEVVSL